MGSGEWEERAINEADRGCGALDVEQNCTSGFESRRQTLAQRRLRRQISRPKAHCLIVFVRAALSVVWCPAGSILKETNGADAPLPAEIEPVQHPARHANKIARFDRDRDHRTPLRTNVEEPAPLDDEPDLVLIVPVLGVEFVE